MSANAEASSSKPSKARDKELKSKHHSSKPHHEKHKSHHPREKREHRSKEKHHDKEKSGPFELRSSSLRLSIPPKFGGDMLAGVKEILDGMVMR